MRLTQQEIQVINENILSIDPDASIYLFGSRTDDDAKGGDIDILVISKKIGFTEKVKIRTGIFERLEEQKIDLVIKKDFSGPFQQFVKPQLKCLYPPL